MKAGHVGPKVEVNVVNWAGFQKLYESDASGDALVQLMPYGWDKNNFMLLVTDPVPIPEDTPKKGVYDFDCNTIYNRAAFQFQLLRKVKSSEGLNVDYELIYFRYRLDEEQLTKEKGIPAVTQIMKLLKIKAIILANALHKIRSNRIKAFKNWRASPIRIRCSLLWLPKV